MKYSLSALVSAVVAAGILLGVSSPASAALTLTPTSGNTPVPGVNNYQANLLALGLTQYTTGTFQNSNNYAQLDFFIHGAESNRVDTFTANGYASPTVSVTEPYGNFAGNPLFNNATLWNGTHAGVFAGFSAPPNQNIQGGTYIGSVYLDKNALLDLEFTSDTGTDAALGLTGFGIFLTAGGSFIANDNYIYFGYNDDPLNGDDNHDDLVISMLYTDLGQADPTPEPASLAIWGAFGVAGLIAARRRKQIA